MTQSVEEILTPEFGSLLRAAREQKHLSVEDVASRLRMNANFIDFMEQGNYKALPPEPYRKSFLKEYAKLVGVSLTEKPQVIKKSASIADVPDAVIGVAKKVSKEAADLTKGVVKTTETAAKKVGIGLKDAVEEITSKDLWDEADEVRKERLGLTKPSTPEVEASPGFRIRERREEAEPEQKIDRRSYLGPRIGDKTDIPEEPIAQASATDDVDSEPYYPEGHGMTKSTKVIIGLCLLIACIIGYSILTDGNDREPNIISTDTQQSEQETAVKKPVRKEETTMNPVEAPAEATDSSDSTADASATGEMKFSITAKEDVWISVASDLGGAGFRGTLHKGESKSFSAKEKVNLWHIGNKLALDMTLDGEPVASLPTIPGSNIVVRDVVLTRQGIAGGAKPGSGTPNKQTANTNTKRSANKQRQPKSNPPIGRPITPAEPKLPTAN